MSKDMKLIMERWDRFVIEEQKQINTVGEMLKVMKLFRQAKAGKQTAIAGLEAIAEQIPGISNIYAILRGLKNAREQLATLYGTDDKFKSNTGLDRINIDDDISTIVDDPIETAFFNYFMKKLETYDPNAPIPDVNREIKDWLASNFNGKTIKV
jgi:hypothetical protein